MDENWCRTCFQRVSSVYYKLDYRDSNDIISIGTKLNSLVPDLDLNVVVNPVICNNCLNIINTAITFKSQCFTVEEHIRLYSQHIKTDKVNFKEVISFIESNKDTVTTEVTLIKDEDVPLYEPEIVMKHNTASLCDNKNITIDKKEEIKNMKQYYCTTCNCSFRWLRNLKRHLNAHQPTNLYICNSCDFKANRKDALKNHIYNKHLDQSKPFKCTYCDVRLAQKYALIRHLQTHADDRPYKCVKCDFTCKFKNYLQRHMTVHTGRLKSFKCHVCDYSSFDRKGLNRHLMIHTGEKPFACIYCDYKTKEKCKLKRHTKIHRKDFFCDICKYRTRYKTSYIFILNLYINLIVLYIYIHWLSPNKYL